jgi:thiol-disulfide isomerase/thioredoxin
VAAVLAAAVGVFVGMERIKPQTPEAQALAGLLAQTLPDQTGQPQALSKWRGKPLLVNFWATWCAPCVKEMPELVALQKQTPDVQIIGIGIDNAEKIAEFAVKLHIDYPLYVAGNGAISQLRALGNQVGGLPFTLLVSADGSIKKTYIGALDFDKLRSDIAKAKLH